mgnify:CR=1 FL=1
MLTQVIAVIIFIAMFLFIIQSIANRETHWFPGTAADSLYVTADLRSELRAAPLYIWHRYCRWSIDFDDIIPRTLHKGKPFLVLLTQQ